MQNCLGCFHEIFKYTITKEGLNRAPTEQERLHLPKFQPHQYLVLSNMRKSFNRLSKMRKQIDMRYSQIDFELHTDGSVRGGEAKCHHIEATTL